jgi:hypothetical protein
MDLKATEYRGVDWISLAQYMVHWQDSVNSLMKLLLLPHYNSDSLDFLNDVLLFKAILELFCPFYKFHLFQVISDIVFPSGLGLPTGLLVNGFHFYIFLTMLVSGILFTCPNQLNLTNESTGCVMRWEFEQLGYQKLSKKNFGEIS